MAGRLICFSTCACCLFIKPPFFSSISSQLEVFHISVDKAFMIFGADNLTVTLNFLGLTKDQKWFLDTKIVQFDD